MLMAIALISLAMHFNHFSKDLMSIHVWRQTQTQSTINNFIEEDMNILNPHRNERGDGNGIFRMEFPLMQWLVAVSCKIFGSHIIITRIWMFIIGLFSVLGMYKLIKNLFQNSTLALIGAWTFNFSPSFFYYTINPLPDNFALCMSIWGLVFFFLWYRKKITNHLIISGLFLSIGALCKLPFILYFIVPLTYFFFEIINKGINKDALIQLILISGFIIFPFAWYVSVVPHWNGNGIVKGVFENNIPFSQTFEYLQYNLFSNLPELLLNYGSVLFFVLGFYFIVKNKSFKNPLFPVLVFWSIAVLGYYFFEVNLIANIHDYYLFPFYPILFILVSYGAYHLLCIQNKYAKYLVVFLLMILPVTAYVRMHVRWNIETPGFNKDLIIYKEELRRAIPQNALCVVGNDESHFIFFYYVDKKGWGFDNHNLSAQALSTMIDKGAKYLYSDSRRVDTDSKITPILGDLILEKGSVKIFRLKSKKNIR